MSKYETLKELEKKKDRYLQFFSDRQEYEYVVLSKNPHKRVDFFEQKPHTKRVTGIPQILDVPQKFDTQIVVDVLDSITDDEINLADFIFLITNEHSRQISTEFAELQNDL